MSYVDVRGVRTYHEVHGSGAPVLLLHGGFCSAESWQPQVAALAVDHEVHVPERPGQGRTPDREGPMRFDDMVADTLAYLDEMDLGAAHLVGFSDGAITGLLLARDHPDRVLSLVAISGNLDPGGFVDDEESGGDEDDGGFSPLRDAYDRLSPDGPEHGDVVMAKLMEMWTSQPQIDPASLGTISTPTLVMAGQHDVIRLDHTRLIASSIPAAQLAIVPGVGHMLTMERADAVNLLLREFLAAVCQD